MTNLLAQVASLKAQGDRFAQEQAALRRAIEELNASLIDGETAILQDTTKLAHLVTRYAATKERLENLKLRHAITLKDVSNEQGKQKTVLEGIEAVQGMHKKFRNESAGWMKKLVKARKAIHDGRKPLDVLHKAVDIRRQDNAKLRQHVEALNATWVVRTLQDLNEYSKDLVTTKRNGSEIFEFLSAQKLKLVREAQRKARTNKWLANKVKDRRLASQRPSS